MTKGSQVPGGQQQSFSAVPSVADASEGFMHSKTAPISNYPQAPSLSPVATQFSPVITASHNIHAVPPSFSSFPGSGSLWNEWSTSPNPADLGRLVSSSSDEPQATYFADSCTVPPRMEFKCEYPSELESNFHDGAMSVMDPRYTTAVPEPELDDSLPTAPLTFMSHENESMDFAHVPAANEFWSQAESAFSKATHFGLAETGLPQVNIDVHSPDFFHFDQ